MKRIIALVLFFFVMAVSGLASVEGQTGQFRITVDTICQAWTICVYDSNIDGGVKSILLLDDPNGTVVIGGTYKYANVSFDQGDDPANVKRIQYPVADRDVCFTVRVDNPDIDAYAPIYIIDENGDGKILELRYDKRSVEFIPNPVVGLTLQPYDWQTRTYERTYVGEEVCKEYLFVTHKTSHTMIFEKAEVEGHESFRISRIPASGTPIYPGDTVKMVVCFKGADTLPHSATIRFETDCIQASLPVYGQAATGLMAVQDVDFGTVLLTTKPCSDLVVENVGSKPFTIFRVWIVHNDDRQFEFDTGHNRNNLPITLQPNAKHKFYCCYTPTNDGCDSMYIYWETSISERYYDQFRKTFTTLSGCAIKPALSWDRTSEKMLVGPDLKAVNRVNLINTGTAETELVRIWIDGPSTDEFRVIATEKNINLPTCAGTVLPVGDTMWVDIEFKADMDLLPDPYAPRIAFLRTAATLDSSVILTIDLRADIVPARVDSDHDLKFAVHPNPARDNVTVNFSLERVDDVHVQIYDILGRKVSRSILTNCHLSANSRSIELPDTDNGMYFIRVMTGGSAQTLPLEIRR